MNYKTEFTPKAERDLKDILLYIARDNSIRALSFNDELIDECFNIAHNPHLFPIIPAFKGKQIRKWNYEKYIIFYRIIGNRVEIVRIIHGARDYKKLF